MKIEKRLTDPKIHYAGYMGLTPVDIKKRLNKLGAYEDIGLSPEEIEQEIRAANASGYADGIKDGKNQKQIPKKPNKFSEKYQTGFCPTCGFKTLLDSMFKYCPECGQALKWSN